MKDELPQTKIKPITTDDFSLICICAIRYSLGRMTYMPNVVQSYIKANLDHFTAKDLSVVINDIEQHGKDSDGNVDVKAYGMEFDYRDWMKFKSLLQHQLDQLTNH